MKGTYRDLVQSFTNATGAKLIIKSMISSKTVEFPAFLTNISQDFKSNWNTENVYGRMDPIASFVSTVRTVQVAFNVPAASVLEAEQNQAKFSTLSQMLYPAYFDSTGMTAVPADSSQGVDAITVQTGEGSKTMSKSPLVRVKFGNLIRAQNGTDGLLGWIDGVSYKPTLTLGMFTKNGGDFYAKNFELSFTLNVLHEDDLGVDSATGDWLGGDGSFPF